MTVIIPTSSAEHIARILEKDKIHVIWPKKNKDGKRHFPDGEVYTRVVGNFEDVLILHSGQPDPNDGLVELEMILQIMKNKEKSVFFTYFPYGMQDKIFQEGETNAAKELVKKLVEYYDVKKIYTIDAHFWGREWVNEFPITNLSALPLLKIKAEEKYEEIFYMTPDLGAERRTGIKGTKKKRIDSYTVEMNSSEEMREKIKGKVVGVIDDLVETGGTMCKAYDFCKENGAEKVIAIITHGVLPQGISRIKKKYDDLFLTNSINRLEANVDISSLIKELL